MKVSPYCLNSPQFAGKAKSKALPAGQSPEVLKAIKDAEQAQQLAQEALNQLHFATGGGNVAYLLNAKALAEFAAMQAGGIVSPEAAYLAKGAGAAALNALEQAEKIEAGNGQKLDRIA